LRLFLIFLKFFSKKSNFFGFFALLRPVKVEQGHINGAVCVKFSVFLNNHFMGVDFRFLKVLHAI